MTIWKQLGLAGPTGNKRAIKKAYARLLRENNPEDNPEGFQKLRQAYEEALEQAEWIDDDVSAAVENEPSPAASDWLEQPSVEPASPESNETNETNGIPLPSSDSWLEGERPAPAQQYEQSPDDVATAPEPDPEPGIDAEAMAANICQQAVYNAPLALSQLDSQLDNEFIELDARHHFEQALLTYLANESGPNGTGVEFIDGVLERFQIDLSKAGQSRDFQMNWLTSRIELRREVARLQQAMNQEQLKQTEREPAVAAAIAFLQSSPSEREISAFIDNPLQKDALEKQYRLLVQASPAAAEELFGEAVTEWAEDLDLATPAEASATIAEAGSSSTWRPWASRFAIGFAIVLLFRVIGSADGHFGSTPSGTAADPEQVMADINWSSLPARPFVASTKTEMLCMLRLAHMTPYLQAESCAAFRQRQSGDRRLSFEKLTWKNSSNEYHDYLSCLNKPTARASYVPFYVRDKTCFEQFNPTHGNYARLSDQAADCFLAFPRLLELPAGNASESATLKRMHRSVAKRYKRCIGIIGQTTP